MRISSFVHHQQFYINLHVHNRLYDKSISGTYRNALECDAFTKYHSLPVLDAVGYNESYSYADCDAERRKCIKQAYNFAMDRLNTTKDTCVAKECANYYSQQLKAKLLPSLDYLKQLSDKVRLTMVYDTLYKLTQDSKDELLSKYNQELQDNPDYYSLYKIDYFIDKVEIKENDFKGDQKMKRIFHRAISTFTLPLAPGKWGVSWFPGRFLPDTGPEYRYRTTGCHP